MCCSPSSLQQQNKRVALIWGCGCLQQPEKDSEPSEWRGLRVWMTRKKELTQPIGNRLKNAMNGVRFVCDRVLCCSTTPRAYRKWHESFIHIIAVVLRRLCAAVHGEHSLYYDKIIKHTHNTHIYCHRYGHKKRIQTRLIQLILDEVKREKNPTSSIHRWKVIFFFGWFK